MYNLVAMASSNIETNPSLPSTSNTCVNLKKCLCHKDGVTGKTFQFQAASWKTFQTAAQERGDDINDKLKNMWKDGPMGVYHRPCYQLYTSSHHIARFKRNQSDSLSDPAETACPTKRSSRTKTPTEIMCVICLSKKYDKTKKNLLPLVQCMTENAAEKLRRSAHLRQDDRMLTELSDRDLIAIEVRYHHSCYVKYTQRTLEREQMEETPKESQSKYENAFLSVRDHVEKDVITEKLALRLNLLTEEFNENLRDLGDSNPNYQSHKVKQRLIKAFGNRISFWQPQERNKSEIVFSSDIPQGQFVESMYNSDDSDEDDDLEMEHSNLSISNQVSQVELYHVAKHIREELKSIRNRIPDAPTAEDMTVDSIPDSVHAFLAWVLSDDDSAIQNPSINLKRRIMAIGQDLVYNVSNGRVKTPKHVSLAVAVKNLTGSAQVISLLNRFGHAISHNELLEMESAMTTKGIARKKDGVIVPNNIQPQAYASFCWDNNDLNEHTLSGSDTTHCTNGIVIQRRILTCEPPPARPNEEAQPEKPPVPEGIIPFHQVGRKGPALADVDFERFSVSQQDVRIRPANENFGWFLLRLQTPENELYSFNDECVQTVPGWSPFNAKLHAQNVSPPTTVGYCQMIDASPTEMNTVHTLIHRSIRMADQLGLVDVVIVMDQAIYCKAKEILWTRPDDFKRVVLRMGAFHICCNFLGIIGKRFGDAGLSDVLIETATVAAGSISGVLNGHHYNRTMRAHKAVYESMLRLKWLEFGTWLENQTEFVINQQEMLNILLELRESLSADTFGSFINMPEFTLLKQAFDVFTERNKGPTATFWESYLSLVALLLDFVRSTREGNWDLHKACLVQMLPWMFAYDHINYARYLTIYAWDMIQLPSTHPVANENMQSGEFAVQRVVGTSFSQVPVDQTIEQTVNRHSKIPGGIVGFSLNKIATERWILTAHDRAAITQSCMAMAGLEKSEERSHKEASLPRIKKDFECVRRIQGYLEDDCNPFRVSEDLVHLTSGVVAPDDVRVDLLDAREKGTDALKEFVRTRLNSSETGFHDPLQKMNLKTFSHTTKAKRKQSSKQTMKTDLDFFAKVLVIAQNRQMDLRDVFSFELGHLPLALASTNGGLCKTAKAKLAQLLERKAVTPEYRPMCSALIIDGMVLFHSIRKLPATFEDLARQILQIIIKQADEFGPVKRVDFVCDSYQKSSIKGIERRERSQSGILQVKITKGSQKCPTQWQKFLASNENKKALIKFLKSEWQSGNYAHILGDKKLYITVSQECYVLSAESKNAVKSTVVPELYSTAEEADGRLILHAYHASQMGHTTIFLKSPDTDVEVLALFYQARIPAKLILVSGTQRKQRIIDIQQLAGEWGQEVCNALPGLHAFTGSDSTSAFSGKGKKISLDLIAKGVGVEACQTLGNDFQVTSELYDACEQFTLHMYGSTSTNVNEARYTLFCSKSHQSQQLPPTRDALNKHIQRANYQAALWKRALLSDESVPSPDGHGWQSVDGELVVCWTNQEPAPKALMEFASCSCKTTCSTRRCTCKGLDLPCTAACRCNDSCQNSRVRPLQEDADETDSDADV